MTNNHASAEVLHYAPPVMSAHRVYFDRSAFGAIPSRAGRTHPDPAPSEWLGVVQDASMPRIETDPVGAHVPPLRSRSAEAATDPIVKARLLWAQGSVPGSALRLLCAVGPTAAISYLFVFC